MKNQVVNYLFSHRFYLVVGILFSSFYVNGQANNFEFYLSKALENNPNLKENTNFIKLNLTDKNIALAQFKKPQVNISSQYLFAPYFFNNGRVISITNYPEYNAYGYNSNVTNGGLYSVQLNASIPLLTKNIINPRVDQLSVANLAIQNNRKILEHDLRKNIFEEYVNVYTAQQELKFLKTIDSLIVDRLQIIEKLTLQGLSSQSDFILMKIEQKQIQTNIGQQKIILRSAFSLLTTNCGLIDSVQIELEKPTILKSELKSTPNYQNKYSIDSLKIALDQIVYNTKYKPQLFAFGNTGLNAINLERVQNNMGISAGIQLIIPISDGGQKNLVSSQNKLILENLSEYKKQNDIQFKNNIKLYNDQLDLLTNSILLIRSQISDQETYLNLVKDKLVSGQVSVMDYLISLQNYYSTNKDLITAESNLWLSLNLFNYINW